MKLQFHSLLFALAFPLAACGGDRDTKTVDFQLSDYVVLPSNVGELTPVAQNHDTPTIIEQPKLVDTTKPMPTKLDELVNEGKRLAADGKFGDAKVMFDAALKLDKKNVTVHVEMARMYISMNEKGLAVASANKAIKYGPLSSQAWNTKGRAELNAHKYDDAVVAFTKAVELDQDNVFAWNNLGYTELQLKKYDDAVEHLTEATSRPGATGYMFNNLGTALEHLDKLDDARTAYDAGGKLGSTVAAASRKRLEGVDTIVVDDVVAAAPTPSKTEYDVTNEGDVDESFPPVADDEHGSGTTDDELEQPSDQATH